MKRKKYTDHENERSHKGLRNVLCEHYKKSFSKIISNLKEHVDFMVKVNVI